MQSRRLASWLCVLLVTSRVEAAPESAPVRNDYAPLPERAVRFYQSIDALSDYGKEKEFTLELELGNQLVIMQLRPCEYVKAKGHAAFFSMSHVTRCWHGTVSNVLGSTARGFDLEGKLLAATFHIGNRMFSVEYDTLNNGYTLRSVLDAASEPSASQPGSPATRGSKGERNRRAVGNERLPKPRCGMKLVADHTYFKIIGNSNVRETRIQMIEQIRRVNGILNLPFDLVPVDVVYDEPPRDLAPGEIHFNMPDRRGDVSAKSLLQSFSKIDERRGHDNSGACIAFLFLARQLDNGTVDGFSNIGHSRSTRGACARPTEDSETNSTYVHNSALASMLANGSRRLTRLSDLVVAHEVAHVLGAQHDPDTAECLPGARQGGPFLMSSFPVNRYDRNHDQLSPCTRRQIDTLMGFEHCLTEAPECGNWERNAEEECDTGTLRDDPCCTSYCRLREGAVCSDMNDLCCQNCQFKAGGTLCRAESTNECRAAASCSGESEQCPPQKALPDNTSCTDRGQCYEGKCRTFCEVQGLLPCLCESGDNACLRCCKSPPEDECRPILPKDYLADGTVCFAGLCKNKKCVKHVRDFIGRFLDVIHTWSLSDYKIYLKKYSVSIWILTMAMVALFLVIYFNLNNREKLDPLRDDLLEKSYKMGLTTRHNGAENSTMPLNHRYDDIPYIDEEELRVEDMDRLKKLRTADGSRIFRETTV